MRQHRCHNRTLHLGLVSQRPTNLNVQIISFLQQNAHPRVAETIPSIPENVADQIRLWASDHNRVEMMSAYLYDEFPSKDVYEAARDFTQEYGVCCGRIRRGCAFLSRPTFSPT